MCNENSLAGVCTHITMPSSTWGYLESVTPSLWSLGEPPELQQAPGTMCQPGHVTPSLATHWGCSCLCSLQGTQMIFNAAKELGQLSKLKVRAGRVGWGQAICSPLCAKTGTIARTPPVLAFWHVWGKGNGTLVPY